MKTTQRNSLNTDVEYNVVNNKRTIRNSHGIAVCRFNKLRNNNIEILMVKKRFTYHFFEFVFGYYKKNDNIHIQYLFDNMTFNEKIDVLSMKFSTMWYRLWLFDPDKSCSSYINNNQELHINSYLVKKYKFDSTFLKDNGKRLVRLINNSSNSSTPWEIPKGVPNKNEPDINCAIRELQEETNIKQDNYTILWNLDTIVSTITDNNIKYKSKYHIAYLNKSVEWSPKINFVTSTQLSEVEQVQWISLDDIKFLNLNNKSKKKLINLYINIIKKFKTEIKSYYYE